MPFDDPAGLDLVALFRDADMFASRRAWGEAGFQVLNGTTNGKIMVARHPTVRGLLFKKYSDDVSQKDQLRNYERRVEGAKRLRAFIDSQRLGQVVVPRKWLFELPPAISRRKLSHVLVVEHLDLRGAEETKAAYGRIELPVLWDLCAVLFHFRGMDSNGKNLPFTTEGRIAFVDTEHWDRKTRKAYLHQVGEYLPSDLYKGAKKIFARLEDGEDPRGMRKIAEGLDDFDDEDDTSSASSS